MALRMMLFVVMMSESFTVRSSSFEPIAESVITDGRIGTCRAAGRNAREASDQIWVVPSAW